MGKVRIFFYILGRTFTSLDYYKEILAAPLSFSVKFFLTYCLLYSIVATAVIGMVVLWPFQSFVTKVLPQEVTAAYPAELEITIKDGAASVNVREPYYIPLSSFNTLKEEFDSRIKGTSTLQIHSLLAIDTRAKIEDFPQYQTLALLTKHHLSVKDDDGNLRSIPLNEMPNTKITQMEVRKAVEMVSPFLPYIVPIAIAMVFIGLLIFMPSWKLIYNFWLAGVLWLLAKGMKRPLSYRKAFQIGLHFLVISTTFLSLWQVSGWSVDFPWLQTILLTLLGVVVFQSLNGVTDLRKK